jgi:glucose/arabinose dehydrogenase
MRSKVGRFSWLLVTVALALLLTQPTFVAAAGTAANPLCPGEDVKFNPGNGEDIVVPPGFTVSVFKSGLNFPTAVAFRGNSNRFEVFVLESGHGLPSRCNDETSVTVGGEFSATNPFTPDILVFNESGQKLRGPLAKPTANGGGLLPHGPAIDIAFENGFQGGRLFATDSNQAIRAVGPQNNSSRIVTVNPDNGQVTPFITRLPTGDHPAEQITFKANWIYWSQGSTTNSGVVGRDNGGGANQPDIPCQDIVLSDNLFDSGGTPDVKSSGYSPFGTDNRGKTIKAFTGALHHGVCDGAILRAQLNSRNPENTIEPFSWGYRNPYGIRFAPHDHALKGGLFVTENGEDERGARPTNNSPDRLQLAQQNPDGSPDYHGWPDRFGFLDSTQAVFNPVGGPGDDNPAAVVGKPVQPVLAFPPQQITAPLALEAADVAIVGLDFVPDSFVHGPVKRGAALAGREGDFGFSKSNGTPEEGHDVQLINFSKPGEPLQLKLERFAHNTTFEQAFVDGIRGINRPVDLKFGPDDCAYLVDYGAVRDFGQSDPDAGFCPATLLNGQPNPAFPGCRNNPVTFEGPLVQIPGTGVIWKICRAGGQAHNERELEKHAEK